MCAEHASKRSQGFSLITRCPTKQVTKWATFHFEQESNSKGICTSDSLAVAATSTSCVGPEDIWKVILRSINLSRAVGIRTTHKWLRTHKSLNFLNNNNAVYSTRHFTAVRSIYPPVPPHHLGVQLGRVRSVLGLPHVEFEI